MSRRDSGPRNDVNRNFILHPSTSNHLELHGGATIYGTFVVDFEGLYSSTSATTTVDTETIGRLLRKCERHHMSCNAEDQVLESHAMPLPVIDVVHFCLIQASTKAQYVALSYVLRGMFFHATKENISHLQKPGSLLGWSSIRVLRCYSSHLPLRLSISLDRSTMHCK